MAKVNIQFTLFSAFYSPLIVVMAGGYLDEEGLEYDWSVSPPGKSAVDAIEDGSADVIQTAVIQGVNDLEQGRTPVAINFALVNAMDGFFISAREPDENFNWSKLEDAEVVMFGGGQPNYMFRYACHKAGIDYERIRKITPGGPADIDAAFRAGQGYYVQQQGPFPQQLVSDGLAHVVAQVGPLIGPCAFSTLAATREWLQTDEAAAFMRAYRKARVYLNEAPAQDVAALIQPYFKDTDASALRDCVASYQQLGTWCVDPEITEPAYQVTLDVFEHAGVLSQRHDFAALCTQAPA